jgi:hypothetical protein
MAYIWNMHSPFWLPLHLSLSCLPSLPLSFPDMPVPLVNEYKYYECPVKIGPLHLQLPLLLFTEKCGSNLDPARLRLRDGRTQDNEMTE